MFCCYVFNKSTLFYIISIKAAILVSICPLSVLEKSTTKIVLYINYRTFLLCPFLYIFLNKKRAVKKLNRVFHSPFGSWYLIFILLPIYRFLIEFLPSDFSCRVFGVISYKLHKLGVVVLKSHKFYDNLLNHIMKIYPLLHSK